MTPLGWSIWGPGTELAVRNAFVAMGSLPPKLAVIPHDTSERFISIFYGRVAGRINFLCEMGDRLPGSSAEIIAGQMLGEVPPEITSRRDLSRLPAIAHRLPVQMMTIRKTVVAGTASTFGWWTDRLRTVDTLDLTGAQRMLGEAYDKFVAMVSLQARGFFIGVQGIYDQLLSLIFASDLPADSANAIMAGQGSHAETEIIVDLWDLGRGRITLETFLTRHGYHGPLEGEVSGRVWREDPTPVIRMAAQYADRPESENPTATAERRMAERLEAETLLLSKLPAHKRPGAKLVLRLAVSRIPLRGIGKAAFLQSLDVARASARRMGVLLTDAGVLSDPEDVFMFTREELGAGLGSDAKQIAATRQELRAELQTLDIPSSWKGNPTPFAVGRPAEDDATVTGIGASGGTVEGVVRVVHDPAFTDVEPDEIIVCATTDPSWASVLFLSAALVVDIGGKLSHAAVVAREVGIPCVINTLNGTRVLATGDRVRVDGNAGTVEILSRARPIS
ncbi:PEP-utilizing protein mobile subunit [Protofrankia coriariae]|uniref:PEP-utilizing protein mobile subunit n=1 Tax=Protofrankia coriariae TaxID=1562887 RepID=A0ABR5F015_9ACTN|nr:PEP-utilizing protein mobile subunit [Protofrankia coriariae]